MAYLACLWCCPIETGAAIFMEELPFANFFLATHVFVPLRPKQIFHPITSYVLHSHAGIKPQGGSWFVPTISSLSSRGALTFNSWNTGLEMERKIYSFLSCWTSWENFSTSDTEAYREERDFPHIVELASQFIHCCFSSIFLPFFQVTTASELVHDDAFHTNFLCIRTWHQYLGKNAYCPAQYALSSSWFTPLGLSQGLEQIQGL